MKLKNLLFGTMVACAFVACSNDDDPIPTPGPDAAEMDATLTVGYAVDGVVKTKAIASEIGDGVINGNIALAVFNVDAMSNMDKGALISYQIISTSETTVDTTACVSAKSGNVQIMVAANLAENDLKGVTDLKGFQKAISNAKMSSQINGNLLMASQVVDVKLLPGRNVICSSDQKKNINWNTPVPDGPATTLTEFKVYRNVAKVQIGSITVKPREDFGERGEYAKFTLTKAFVDHVRYNALVFGANDKDSKWNSVRNVEIKDGKHLMLSGSYATCLSSDFDHDNIFGFGKASTEASTTPDLSKGKFYVFDNANTTGQITDATSTRLILQGTYQYKDDKGDLLTSENAYWIAEINNNKDAASNGDFAAHWGVMRNVEYTLDITITGPGMGDVPNPPVGPDPENPDTPKPVDPTPENPNGQKACIQVAVTPVAWGTVTDHPVID